MMTTTKRAVSVGQWLMAKKRSGVIAKEMTLTLRLAQVINSTVNLMESGHFRTAI
ncbi:hypothetical protein ACNKHV_14035 [Shigella flexneri]